LEQINKPLGLELGVNFLIKALVSVAMDLFLLVSISEQRFLPQHRTTFALRTLMISSTDPRFAGAFAKPNNSEYFLRPVNDF
jgi:hypothetical protein